MFILKVIIFYITAYHYNISLPIYQVFFIRLNPYYLTPYSLSIPDAALFHSLYVLNKPDAE